MSELPTAVLAIARQHVDGFIERIVGLGGSKIRDVIDDAGYFAVMHDPEGNEFCIG